jgi:acetaldehyde dehydrogenase/alcohol dehydrogenase
MMDSDNISQIIESLIENGKMALQEMVQLSQEQVDCIVKEMALAGLDNHMRLAQMAVAETKRGVYEDKVIKNLFATEYVYHSIKYQKTVGIINENEEEDYYEIAEPVGIIAGITPVTNPTSTTLFKCIIAMGNIEFSSQLVGQAVIDSQEGIGKCHARNT